MLGLGRYQLSSAPHQPDRAIYIHKTWIPRTRSIRDAVSVVKVLACLVDAVQPNAFAVSDGIMTYRGKPNSLVNHDQIGKLVMLIQETDRSESLQIL